MSMKNSLTPAGIEPATFRFVTQRLNHCATLPRSPYFTLLRSKLEQSSPVCNNVMATNTNKRDRVQQQFAALYFTGFFSHILYNYACALELLKLRTYFTSYKTSL